MDNSQGAHQPNNDQNPFDKAPQTSSFLIQSTQDFFCFLKSKGKTLETRPFFSENSLGQDIITVTNAEPDICLEVFYALYHVLWPQLEEVNEHKKLGMEQHRLGTSLQDAWTNFIGGSLSKGVLWSPEKLMDDPQVVEENFSKDGGEEQVFLHLEAVRESILNLKTKVANFPGEISQREEIMASLELVQEYYTGFRNKVTDLLTMILENKESKKNYQALQSLLEPKAIMMSDIFDHHWAYRIPRRKAQKLLSLDKWRGPLGSYSSEGATHRVAALPEKNEALEPLVYFKANGRTAIQPEKEFMLYSLYRHLQIPVPETALLILTNVFSENPDFYYAVQASEAVTGESALEACKNAAFEQEAFVSQAIGALLTDPSDGSFKNFKYSPKYKTLVGIDNDLVFKPEFTGKDGRTVNVKSVLYLLPQMDLALPKVIKTFFTTLDPCLVILSWLKDLCQKNREYNLLFSKLAFQKTRYIYQNLLLQDERPSLAICTQEKVLVDPDLHHDSFHPQILVSKSLLASLTEKFQTIEKTLLNSGSASSQILFEEISPFLGKYYHKSRLKFSDPEEALDAVWGVKKNGVDYSEVASLLSPEELDGFSFNKNVLDENLLPEAFFHEYKKKVISGEAPLLDKFIQRHGQRKRNNLLNLNQALEELQFLIKEELTDSQSPRDIIGFCYSISKMTEADHHLIKEITSLLSNLPSAELKWLLTLEEYFKREESDVPEHLRPSSLEITSAFLKKRIFHLTAPEKEYIFDDQGNIKKNNTLTGRANVTWFPEGNPQFYLKQYPEWPGYEFASISFMRLLGVTHLPYQDLIVKNSKYPVLLTQAVDGVPVFRLWQNSEAFNCLDPFHTGLLIIAAILLNPEDGKEDNFLLSPDGKYLIPIDSDHSFLPSTIRKEGNIWNAWTINTTLQTKTLLFCLDEMKEPIPLEVRQHFLEIDFDKHLKSWIKELIKVEDRYKNLVGEDQQKAFLDIGTVLRIPFYEQFIHNLYWKINKIKDLLRTTSEQTPLSLLRAVEPFVARCYQDSVRPGEALKSRFEAATKNLYISTENKLNGSRMSVLQTETMMKLINISKKDLQHYSTYEKIELPYALEVLERCIQERSQNRKMEQDLLCELDDKNEEGILTTLFGNPLMEEALKNFFLNSREGLVLKGSKFIESSKLKAFFRSTSDQGAKIKFLSLPNSPLLDTITLRTLVEGCPNIEYLNVSGCVKLQEIVAVKGEWPLLVRIEAKGCLMLDKVDCSSPIRVLRIGTSWKIEISLEESSLDVLDIYMKKRQFDFHFKKGQGFGIKSINKPAQNFEFAFNFQDALDFYFKGIKIKIGKDSILSGQDFQSLASFFEVQDDQKDPLVIKERAKFWKAFLFKGNWSQLRCSRLSFCGMDDEGLSELSSKKWPLLKTLDLSNTKVTPRRVFSFVLQVDSPNLQEIIFTPSGSITREEVSNLLPGKRSFIEKIDLSGKILNFDNLQSVQNWRWSQLKYLDISTNEIFDEDLAILSQGEWPMLEVLNLNNNRISIQGVILLLLQENWPNLKEIIFRSWDYIENGPGNNFLPKKWPFLETLDLTDTEITPSGFIRFLLYRIYQPNIEKVFCRVFEWIDGHQIENLYPRNWFMLENLDLHAMHITQWEVDAIRKIERWPHLKYLDVSDSEIGGEALCMLPFEKWPLLEELRIININITPESLEIFANHIKLPNLKKLDISYNKIYDQGLDILAHGKWPLLEYIDLTETNTTVKRIASLKRNPEWPNIRVLKF